MTSSCYQMFTETNLAYEYVVNQLINQKVSNKKNINKVFNLKTFSTTKILSQLNQSITLAGLRGNHVSKMSSSLY